MEKLERLWILLDKIFTIDLFDNIDFDGLLDMRDSSTIFDQNWITAHHELDEIEVPHNISDNEHKLIDKIREEVFWLVYKHSTSPELAYCVSDDFEMISEAVCIVQKHSWICALLYQYICGEIPHKDLPVVDKTFDELLGVQ